MVLSSIKERIARVEERVSALDRLADEKFITLKTLMVLEADKVSLALTASDKAITKAEAANEKRFESVNEFRSTLTDQQSTFVTRAEHNALISGIKAEHQSDLKAMVEKFEDMKARIDKSEGRGVGLNAGWLYLLGIVAAAGTVISFILVLKP